jgi:hypothetical protein
MTGAGLSVETFAWSLFAAALLAFFTGQARFALGLGIPAGALAVVEWLSPAPVGVGVAADQDVPAGLPPALPTFAVAFAACLGLRLAWTRWRPRVKDGRSTELPYPDLVSGAASSTASRGDGAIRRDVEPLGRWDAVQWDNLNARLADLTRDFLGYVVPRPGQSPKIDLCDSDALLMIDCILGAADLVVGASGDDEPQVLAAAIRDMEWRWIVIRHRRDFSHHR